MTRDRRWTEEAIIEAIQAWTETHGDPPTMHGWAIATDSHPSSTHVRNCFGSWNEALEAAGCETIDRGQQRHMLDTDTWSRVNVTQDGDIISQRPLWETR